MRYISQSQANRIFNELDLFDNWNYITDGDGFSIDCIRHRVQLSFDARKRRENLTYISTGISSYFPFISYIIKEVCPEYDYATSIQKDKYFDIVITDENGLFNFALPIWKEQWTELKPYLYKYDTPQKLYEAELASLENDENPLWYGSSFFGLSYNEKSIILSRLISEQVYTKRKAIYEKLTEKPASSEQSKLRRESTKRLFAYLDKLDVEQYLNDKPWIEGASVAKELNSIELDRTAMLAISHALSDQGIAQLCATDSISKGDNFIAAEAARMSFSGKTMLHMLQMTPSVIAFIPDPVVYEQIDLAQVSGEAVKFVIDEETTDSIRIDYYRDGVLLLEYMQSMGEVLEAKQHPDFDLSVDDPISLIESLFAKISGRRLDSIMGDEEGLIYQLN